MGVVVESWQHDIILVVRAELNPLLSRNVVLINLIVIGVRSTSIGAIPVIVARGRGAVGGSSCLQSTPILPTTAYLLVKLFFSERVAAMGMAVISASSIAHASGWFLTISEWELSKSEVMFGRGLPRGRAFGEISLSFSTRITMIRRLLHISTIDEALQRSLIQEDVRDEWLGDYHATRGLVAGLVLTANTQIDSLHH